MSMKFDPPSISEKGESLRAYLRRFIEKLNKSFTEQSVKSKKRDDEIESIKKELKNITDRVTFLSSKLGE